MIIEIALGIVLAVIILSLLPVLIAVGAMALAIVVVLALGGLLIYWAVNSTESFLAIASIAIVVIAGVSAAGYIAKRTVLMAEEAGGLMIIAAILGFAGFSLFEQHQRYGHISTEARELLLPLTILAVMGVILWRRIRKRKRGTHTEA